jgi:hypothetical protein
VAAEQPIRKFMSFDQHVQLARVNSLRKFGRWTDMVVICAAIVAALVFWPEIDHLAMAAWLSCMAFVSGIRIWLSWRTDGDIESITTATYWQKIFLTLTLLLGVVWATPAGPCSIRGRCSKKWRYWCCWWQWAHCRR